MQIRGLLSRRAWALAFILAALSTVAAVLAGQSARVLVRAPLVARPARGVLVSVPLEVDHQLPPTNDETRQRIALETDAASELLGHEELWLSHSPAPARDTRVPASPRPRCGSARLPVRVERAERGRRRPAACPRRSRAARRARRPSPVVRRLGHGDLVVYHPGWWRPLCAAVPLVPFFLFKRVRA